MSNRSILLILLAALAGGMGLWASQRYFGSHAAAGVDAAPTRAVRLFSQPRPLPAFALQGPGGGIVDASALAGRWSLVFLGFTHCPDVCPTTLGDLARAEQAWQSLPDAQRPQVLFVSVDPERDSPDKAADYARYFSKRFLAATAPVPALETFARSLGMVFVKVPMEGGTPQTPNYSMDHSSIVAVIDPQGRMVGLIRPPLDPAAIAADMVMLSQGAWPERALSQSAMPRSAMPQRTALARDASSGYVPVRGAPTQGTAAASGPPPSAGGAP